MCPHCCRTAIAVDIARNVTMLGPIIAQRHQQLLAKFGSVGTVWRKLFETPKAQCLLGCLSQFGFGGTGGFDYAQLGGEENSSWDRAGQGALADGGVYGADASSCEPQTVGRSRERGASLSSLSLAEAAAAAGFPLPPGFNLSSLSPSDMKAAAASMGFKLPADFDMPPPASFGRDPAAASCLPSASLPRAPPTPSLVSPAFLAASFGLAPPVASASSHHLCLA